LRHPIWLLGGGRGPGWSECALGEGRPHGAGLIARMDGCASREDAERLRGMVIALWRGALPEPEADEFYWADLIGAEVVGPRGEVLGNVTAFMETGANDVMVVNGDRERLIPFLIHDTVARVDLIGRKVVVNWDPDF
jgi:16S rRNA processing protein RimM